MSTDEAVRILRKHNGEFNDETDTLIGNLRPYVGINKLHFSEIVKALYFAASLLNTEKVDRDLVHTIWSLTRTARLWTCGPREPMFHGRNFISDDDKRTLDRWIAEIESITLYLLRGFEDWNAIENLAEEINRHDSIVDPSWLVSPFIKSLQFYHEMENEGDYGDDEEHFCDALIKIGPSALPAVSAIKQVAAATRFPNVKTAAERAITILTPNRDQTDGTQRMDQDR